MIRKLVDQMIPERSVRHGLESTGQEHPIGLCPHYLIV